MILASTIDRVKDIPILQVVEKYHTSEVKKNGVNYLCMCPFHADKHPSFTISVAKNIVKCFACSTPAMDPVGFVMELKKIQYPEAIKMLAADFGIKVEETEQKKRTPEEEEKQREMEALVIANSWAADWYHNQLLSALEKHFPDGIQETENKLYGKMEMQGKCDPWYEDKEKQTVAYIFTRFKCSVELIRQFKIGFIPDGFTNLFDAAIHAQFKSDTLIRAGLAINKEGRFRDYFLYRPMIIPIHSHKGRIVGFTARQMPWNNGKTDDGKEYPKYINTADTLIFKKGSVLFGFDTESQAAARKADKVYLVEGNTDKTSLFYIGVKNVLTKSGTALTDDQVANLMKLTKNVCLLDDGDNAGQLSMYKNGEKLTLAGCNVSVITLPEGQDPDSFFESKEHFFDFEKENERDYIINVRGIDEYNATTNLQVQKKIRQGVAELLLAKEKDDRAMYVGAIVKETDTKASDWYQAIKAAAMGKKNKGLNISEDQEGEKIQPDNTPDNRQKHDFYTIKQDAKGNPVGIEIDSRKFLLRLKSTRTWEFEREGKTIQVYFGFFIYSLSEDESETIFVQLRDGRIKKVSINFMKNTFFKYVRLLKPYKYEGYNNEMRSWEKIITNRDIEGHLINKVTTLFEEKRLILFPDRKIEILQDAIDRHYTFFRNCYVISTRAGYTIHDYENLKEGYVWDDAVLDRSFHEPKNDKPGIFEKFVHDISGNEWDLTTDKAQYPEKIRYKSLLVAGGYALHNFTDMKRKAVILTQGRISEDDTSEGREGKTLFVESLGRYMLNKLPDESKTYVYVPGKDLKSDDKHKWMDLELNTSLVLYDDPPQWIQFEDLYNLAERSFKVEKKRMDNLYVKARIFITTNRPLERDSGSSRDRSCVIELDSIFSADYSPMEKYKHYFFRDWTGDLQDEWNKFSKYVMGTMLPAYFQANCNLLEPPSKNLYRNELLQKAKRISGSVDIVFWLDYLVKGDGVEEPFFKLSETYRGKDLYNQLLADREHYRDNKKLKASFSKLVKAYFQKEGISFFDDRDASGTTFTITGGLKKYRLVNHQLLVDFFSNGSGYTIGDIDDNKHLTDMVQKFNLKFDTNITTLKFKQMAIELAEGQLPF